MTGADPTIKPRARLHRTVVHVCAFALLAGALGGCYTPNNRLPEVPNDARLRHPISIQEGDHVIELFVGRNRGGLTPAQRAEVMAFAHTWKREATGGLVVEVPVGTPNARAAADTVPEVRSILLGATGLPANAVQMLAYHPDSPIKLATIRIKYPKMVAEAGPCGLWPDDLGPSVANSGYFSNKPYWNLGCATQRNFAAMVADPADLVQPRGEGPAYTGRRTVVFDKYRKGQSTATVYPKTDQSKISDLGK